MDSETDLTDISNGNYLPTAYNIRHKTTDGNSTNPPQNILGNEYVYTGGSVTRQNKRVAIAINAIAAGTGTIVFKSSGNGTAITTTSFTIPINDVETAIDNAVSAANTALTSYGGVTEIASERIVNSNTSASYVIEMGGLSQNNQGIDWQVSVTGSQTFLFTTQEAIPEGLAGDLIKTAHLVLNNNNFQYWTTQQLLPETRQVVEASNASPIRITEDTAHGLSVGDLVNISGVKRNTNANGLWFVSSVADNFTYDLAGSASSGTTASIGISSGTQYLSTGEILITTSGAHSISNGATVFITGSDASANGEWEALVISTTTLVLKSSTYTGNFGAGGTIVQIANATHNPVGLGEIGVVTVDSNDLHTYTRLIRSTEFNFRTKKQQDIRGQFYNDTYAIYWDDDFNTGRVFYYDYVAANGFVTDGAINYIDTNGRYTYGDISTGLNLILVPDTVDIAFEGQLQSGGALTAGNKRYAVSLVTSSLEGTAFSKLSPPIPVYSANTNNPTNILGNEAGEGTSKANQIRISGIDPDVFPFVQVAVVDYSGGSFSGTIIDRYEVPVGGELVVTHFGNESTAQDLDLTLLNQITADIQSAKNIEILENRLIRSNITATAEYDLSEWAQNSSYRLKRGSMTSVGSGEAPVFGEYQDPSNVFNFTSAMLNETYRMGIQLEDRDTGVWTRVYHVGDFKFDTSAIGGRKLETLTDYNLTNTPTPPADATETYYFYLTLEGFDWDYVLPNGKTIREQYKSRRFSRAEINTRTILQTGIVCPKSDKDPLVFFGPALNSCVLSSTTAVTSPSFPYALGATDTRRQSGVLFSPDYILGSVQPEYVSGDELYTFGQPLFQRIKDTGTGAGTRPTAGYSTMTELYGAVGTSFDTHDLDGITPITSDETVVISGVTIEGLAFLNGLNTPTFNRVPSGLAFAINTTFITDTAGLMASDYAVYYYQYYRASSNQYGSPENNQWIDLSAIYEITNDTSSSTQDVVYLQDCFTQKSYIRIYDAAFTGQNGKVLGFYSQNLINSQLRNETGETNQFIFPKGNGSNSGFDGRINEVTVFENTEPFEYNLGYNLPVQIQSEVGYDSLFPKQTRYPSRVYYSAFKPSGSLVDYFRTFLPLDFYDQDEKFGEINGMLAVNGELYTWQEFALYRQFFSTRAEFNSSDDTQTIVVGSGNVFAQRGRMVNSIGLTHKWGINIVKTNEGRDAVYWINAKLGKLMRFAGDGARIISENEKGEGRMRAFLANNLKWTIGKDTPADSQGIHIGINLRYSEIYLTVRAKKETSAYDNSTTYSAGDSVLYTPNLYERNFEQTGEIYEYTNPSPASGNLPTDTDYWRKIPHSDNNYYNEYTLVYDEDRNTFECFYHVKPTIWESWNDKIYSPRPVTTRSRMYLHEKGYYGRWYVENGETLGSITKSAGSVSVSGSGTSFLSEFQDGYGLLVNGNTLIVIAVSGDTGLRIDDIYIDANGDVQTGATALSFTGASYVPISQQLRHSYVEPIANMENVSIKWYKAILFSTLIMPYYVNFKTTSQISYLDSGDTSYGDPQFIDREGLWFSPIQNDSTLLGINNGDSSQLYGKWLRIKLTYRYLLFQVLEDIIVKQNISNRNHRN